MFAAMVASAGGGDKTPTAVNWANIIDLSPASNANQTLAGVVGGIRLHFDVTIDPGCVGTLEYDINDGAGVSFVDNDTLLWTVGQTLSFTATRTGGINPFSGSISVKNASDGMTELDSFTYAVGI